MMLIYLMLGLDPHGMDLGFLGLGFPIKNTNKKNIKYFWSLTIPPINIIFVILITYTSSILCRLYPVKEAR